MIGSYWREGSRDRVPAERERREREREERNGEGLVRARGTSKRAVRAFSAPNHFLLCIMSTENSPGSMNTPIRVRFATFCLCCMLMDSLKLTCWFRALLAPLSSAVRPVLSALWLVRRMPRLYLPILCLVIAFPLLLLLRYVHNPPCAVSLSR